MGGWQNF